MVNVRERLGAGRSLWQVYPRVCGGIFRSRRAWIGISLSWQSLTDPCHRWPHTYRTHIGRLEIPVPGTMIPDMGIESSTPAAIVPRRSGSPGVSALADALFTSTQRRVLALLFGQPDRDFFVTEMITLAGSGRGAVQRELARLAGSGESRFAR